jgi:uncharacterized protein involved in exopolysaccharide biosynthesis
LAPRVYLASTRLQVISPPPGAVTLYGGFRSGGFRDEIEYTQSAFVEILTSNVVARRTIEATDTRLSDEGLEERIDELRERTKAEVESDFIKVTVTGDNAEEAAQVANSLATEGLAYYGELLGQSSRISKAFISAELELARKELDQAQTDLMRFKIENKVGSLDDDISQQTGLIRSLRLSRDEAAAKNETDRANTYDALIARREQDLQTLLNLSAEYHALQSAVEQASSTYDYLLGKEAEATITENQIRNISFILVVEPATPPRRSTSSFSKNILALGGVLSLALGLAIAFAWEYFDASDARENETHSDSQPQRQPARVH